MIANLGTISEWPKTAAGKVFHERGAAGTGFPPLTCDFSRFLGLPNLMIELHWTTSHSASCFHAAHAVSEKLPLVDTQLATALQPPTRALEAEFQTLGLALDRAWQYLLEYSCQIPNNRELAQMVLRKLVGQAAMSESRSNALAGRISDVEAAVDRCKPDFSAQLLHRVRPLREQWEARGPGLVRAIGRLSDARLIVSRAELVLVYPALGGGGAAHLMTNAVRLEAVLTNNDPELPEVVRLGWLLAQLNCDLPIFGETVPANRLPWVAALAMLPVTLKAAEQVELAALRPDRLAPALHAWHLVPPDRDQTELAEMLWSWWETFQESAPDWKIALAALDRMV